ncbi:MAG: aminotransferase class I/II-fold pyridoxal phosphate-dependent enzyme [Bacteroidales bacterium]|nr:aminotransferase class I/II-fold pyridoxal phosphate-dependent enzyme [Bacteroidales bacterium]
MDFKKLRFETRQIHAGLTPDEPTGSRGVAIYPTAAYRFKDCGHAARLFELSEGGNIYTRLQNPTSSSYEERVNALYGGVGAVATSSGMSAILIAVTSLAAAGQNIVASPFLYGGTYNFFRHTLRKLGIEIRIADVNEPEAYAPLIDGNTRAIFAESMGNPTCEVSDIEGLAAVAHSHGIPLVIDNTFGAGGYLCNPFDWGADIVVDSATKWINGHGNAMGGIIVDGGKFDWNNGKFPQIAGPSEGYHGLNLYEAFGPAAFVVKCRVDGLRDFGASPSAFDSYLMMLGLETLSLRVRHQIASTRKLAEWLRSSPFVKRVSYVGFPDHNSHEKAKKYFRDGGSAVLTVELNGTLDTTVKFVESLQLAAHMTMIGDSITVVTHPASTTHKQLSDADLAVAGVTPTLLRISVGLEDTDDIIDDFQQAFEASAQI